MTPKKFKETNIIFGKDQEGYQPLPAHRKGDPNGEVISCWELSFKERLIILFKGEIWLCLITFNKPISPTYLTVKKSEVFPLYDNV